jgi:hypothetical protein
MDLTAALLRAGAARPHVLVVAMPGATAVCLAAEQQMRRRGWPTAMTPADADILLLAGEPAGRFAEVAAAAWHAMPAPRARAAAASPGEVDAVLEAARARLADRARQQAGAAAGVGHEHEHGGDQPEAAITAMTWAGSTVIESAEATGPTGTGITAADSAPVPSSRPRGGSSPAGSSGEPSSKAAVRSAPLFTASPPRSGWTACPPSWSSRSPRSRWPCWCSPPGSSGRRRTRGRFFGLMLLFAGALLVTVTAATLPPLLMG